MSINIFNDTDIKILSKNKYIKNVSHKGITYTDEFKRLFIADKEKIGKLEIQNKLLKVENEL